MYKKSFLQYFKESSSQTVPSKVMLYIQLLDKPEFKEIAKKYIEEPTTEEWLEHWNIENYHINEDGTVDVRGYVNLDYSRLKKIPIKFGKVGLDFSCEINLLTSLEGCPTYVGGNFFCANNAVQFTKEDVKKLCEVKGKILTKNTY